jgi:hypothetical protein
MIVELADTINSHDEEIERMTYQITLFPEPATKRRKLSNLFEMRKHQRATHVSHGPIEANPARIFSIPRTCHLERTTLQALRGASRGQRGEFSMDRGERASFEYLAAACHLPDNLSDSGQQWQR